jgi:hypothetical protein
MRTLLRALLVSVVCASLGIAAQAVPAAAAAPPPASQAQMLYCGYWSYAVAPRPVPVGFESHFAVVVVEINSPAEVDNVSVSDLALLGEKGVAVANMQRLLKADIFDEPYVAGESNAKYYLGTDPAGRTRPWDGTLPAGKIRLRASAAVVEDPVGVRGCRLTVGKYVIEGPVTFRMAT